METLSHERSFAILNLNHCGIESLQGFLCVHLRVCMCERGGARSRGPGCVFKDLKCMLGVLFFFFYFVCTHGHILFSLFPLHTLGATYAYVPRERVRTYSTSSTATKGEETPFMKTHSKLYMLFFSCAAEVRSRGADLYSLALDFSPNTCLVGSFSYTSRGVGKDAANSNTEGGFLFLSYYRLARLSCAHLCKFRNKAPLRFFGTFIFPQERSSISRLQCILTAHSGVDMSTQPWSAITQFP